jgi:hypothetical protein
MKFAIQTAATALTAIAAAAMFATTSVCLAATPAAAASAPTKAKSVKCGKGTEKVKVVAIKKAPTAGNVIVGYAGAKGAKGDALKSDDEVKAEGLVVGAEFCMDKGEL